jgi:hypothetical protein
MDVLEQTVLASTCAPRVGDNGHRRSSIRRNSMRAIISMAAFCVVIASPAKAIRPDECEQQRAAFPKEWNDVSKEKPRFFCWSHYSGALKVTLGAGDKEGRRLMSLVPLSANDKKAKQDTSKDVFRIWLDREQTRRLEDGKYFATIVRQKGSCWIRGALSGPDDGQADSVFLLDMANPKSDSPDAGSFYNKAPRFSVFQGDSYECEAIK